MKSIHSILLLLLALSFPSITNGQLGPVKGFTEPYRSIDIAASEMGTVSSIEIREGQDVPQGMVLARLNEEVLAASLDIAKDAKNAKGKLNSALAEFNIQRQKFAKLKGLFERKHASQSELDRALGQVNVAKAQVEAVKDELKLRELELIRIEKQLEQRRLRSPINGVVTEVYKDEGEFVSANDPNVVKVVQLDPLLVVFMVPHGKASQLSQGQSIDLSLGKDRQRIQGEVEYVSPTADAQSGTRRVKVKIPNSQLRIPSGLACYLDLQSSGKQSATRQVSLNPSR